MLEEKSKDIKQAMHDAVLKAKVSSQLSNAGDAEYYLRKRIETLRKAEQVYGTAAAMYFCEINADKYRDRIGEKDGQPIEQELIKIRWYDAAAKHYFDKLQGGEGVEGIDSKGVKRHKWK